VAYYRAMKRRTFLAGAAGAAAAATACKGPSASDAPAVHTGQNVRWRLASSFPKGLDTIYGAAEVLSERVKRLSGGKFEIRPYAAGELVPGLQVLDAVQEGSAQVGHTAGYYYTGKNPALAFDTCVPFGMTARQQTAWLLEGGGMELIREVYAEFGVINFVAGNTGVQMGGWFKREVNSAAELQGLRIRIPGLGGEVMNRLGATVQVLAGGDIYMALERGAIDATEWVGPYDDEKLGFHKVAKLYYYPGWWEPGPNLSLLVNKAEWDKLPAEYKEMFEAASYEAATVMQTRYDQRNAAALVRLLDAGVEMRRFSDDLMTAAHKASVELLAELAAKDAGYRKIYDHWSKARTDAYRWFGTAEAAYAEYAFPKG